MDTKDIYEISLAGFACIISIAAIIASSITWYKSNKVTKKIAEKTINKKYFEQIYFEYIILKLPSVLSKIQNGEGSLSENCNEANNIITTLIERSQFYKYFEEGFYNDIKQILVDIDEKLIFISERDINRFVLERYRGEITVLANELYEVLNNYYSKI